MTTKVAIAKNLQVGILRTVIDSSYVLSVLQLMFLMLIPKN